MVISYIHPRVPAQDVQSAADVRTVGSDLSGPLLPVGLTKDGDATRFVVYAIGPLRSGRALIHVV